MGVYEYTPTSMSYEGNNRGKREALTRTGQEHATRETKTTKINPIMWLLQGFFPQANMYSLCHVRNRLPVMRKVNICPRHVMLVSRAA